MNIVEEYFKLFGELPDIPIMCNYSQIEDLMYDAIISKKPLSQDEVNKFFENMNEPYDINVKNI